MLKQATPLTMRHCKIGLIPTEERKRDFIWAGLPNLASAARGIAKRRVTPVTAIFFFTGHDSPATDFLLQKLKRQKSATSKFPSIGALFKKLTANVLGWFLSQPFHWLGSVPMKCEEIIANKIKVVILKTHGQETVFIACKISSTHG